MGQSYKKVMEEIDDTGECHKEKIENLTPKNELAKDDNENFNQIKIESDTVIKKIENDLVKKEQNAQKTNGKELDGKTHSFQEIEKESKEIVNKLEQSIEKNSKDM